MAGINKSNYFAEKKVIMASWRILVYAKLLEVPVEELGSTLALSEFKLEEPKIPMDIYSDKFGPFDKPSLEDIILVDKEYARQPGLSKHYRTFTQLPGLHQAYA